MSDRVRTVFLGTGSFAVPVVAALVDNARVELDAIVTAPPRVGSRGRPAEPPVASWAAEHSIAMLRPERLRSAQAADQVAALRPGLLVLADYGQLVPERLLDLPRHGALNLHPSLLPRHRGATPIPAAILAGDQETGVTLMRMDAGLDTGPVVAQWRHALNGMETGPYLEAALAALAARLLTATLEPWLEGKIKPVPQGEGDATLTRPLRRADGRLDPMLTAAELERRVRALQPWPGSFIEADGARIVVWRASVGDARGGTAVGALQRAEDHLALVAADALLVLEEVQPAGGRRMSGAELLRGRPGLVGVTVAAPADAGQ